MSTNVVKPSRWRKRLWRLTITCTLMGMSFAIGVALTAFIAFRVLSPIAATGMTMGVLGMASASMHATTTALYSGDSATRLAVLTQLRQTFDADPRMTFDDQTSAWILPAIEQCKTDLDPEVVSLAEGLATFVKDRTLPPPRLDDPTAINASDDTPLLQADSVFWEAEDSGSRHTPKATSKLSADTWSAVVRVCKHT